MGACICIDAKQRWIFTGCIRKGAGEMDGFAGKKRKKWVSIGMGMLLCILSACSCAGETADNSRIPDELKNLYACSAVLMDGDSGRVLFGKNEKEALPMASTTKIMTCILALELADPGEICIVTEKAASQPQVHLGIRTGETYYLKDLLYSLMLESHNDSAVCVAEHIGGSVEEFAELMNQKAEEIGCSQAHFVTPNGLDGSDAGGEHRISAGDLALVMRYCIRVSEKKEEFLEITRTAQYSFQDVSGKRSFSCTNHNSLLNMMEGALTGKTGFTGKAGYCYVGAVRREDKTLIVALLACGWPNNRSYKWSDTRKLVEYGFANYEKKSMDISGIRLPQVEVLHGTVKQVSLRLGEETAALSAGADGRKDGTVTVLAEEGERLQVRMNAVPVLEAPVQKGQQAGTLEILLEDTVLAAYSLLCSEVAERLTYWFCLERVLEACLF